MNSYITKTLLVVALIVTGSFVFTSCSDDASPVAPTISLDQETIQGMAGETISVVVTYSTPEGFGKLVIEKKIDSNVSDTQTISENGSGSYQFDYEILVEDSDGILSFTFTIHDETDMTASRDLVVDVEITNEQKLNRYNWLLSDEIRKKTGESDITDAYTDDVYRFNEDGTYDVDLGEKVDDFGDHWFNRCYWNLSDDDVLILTRTGVFGEDVRDTLYVNTLTIDELRADVTYYGLDAFNTGEEAVPYEPEEEYEKVFVSVPKGAGFNPYGTHYDDDGPAGFCNDVDFN